MNWKQISKEQAVEACKHSNSIKEFTTKLGYKGDYYGDGYKRIVEKYNLDTSHFIKREEGYNKKPVESKFRNGVSITAKELLKPLIDIRGRRCECCHLEKWNGKEIPLEVHHKDGNQLNNSLKNLQILCPNCHAQTENWRGRNISKEFIDEIKFLDALKDSSTIRQALIKINLVPKGGNYTRAKKLISKYNLTHLK